MSDEKPNEVPREIVNLALQSYKHGVFATFANMRKILATMYARGDRHAVAYMQAFSIAEEEAAKGFTTNIDGILNDMQEVFSKFKAESSDVGK